MHPACLAAISVSLALYCQTQLRCFQCTTPPRLTTLSQSVSRLLWALPECGLPAVLRCACAALPLCIGPGVVVVAAGRCVGLPPTRLELVTLGSLVYMKPTR